MKMIKYTFYFFFLFSLIVFGASSGHVSAGVWVCNWGSGVCEPLVGDTTDNTYLAQGICNTHCHMY